MRDKSYMANYRTSTVQTFFAQGVLTIYIEDNSHKVSFGNSTVENNNLYCTQQEKKW